MEDGAEGAMPAAVPEGANGDDPSMLTDISLAPVGITSALILLVTCCKGTYIVSLAAA